MIKACNIQNISVNLAKIQGKLPYWLSGTGTAQFEFDCPGAQARHPARLRIHTSDQSEVAPTVAPTVVQITFDGRRLQQTLPKGLGI